MEVAIEGRVCVCVSISRDESREDLWADAKLLLLLLPSPSSYRRTCPASCCLCTRASQTSRSCTGMRRSQDCWAAQPLTASTSSGPATSEGLGAACVLQRRRLAAAGGGGWWRRLVAAASWECSVVVCCRRRVAIPRLRSCKHDLVLARVLLGRDKSCMPLMCHHHAWPLACCLCHSYGRKRSTQLRRGCSSCSTFRPMHASVTASPMCKPLQEPRRPPHP